MEHLVKDILVCYDGSKGSKKALEIAKHMASLDSAVEVNLISVVQIQLPYEMYAGSFLIDQRKLISEYEEHANKLLDDIKKEWTLPNRIYSHVFEGNPAEEIVDFASRHKMDLVVIGNRSLGPVKELLLGSVSHHVVQKAHCPVLVAK